MAGAYLPKPPGYADPSTGRVAVLVGDLADSVLNGDVSAYYLDPFAEARGRDPWRKVDGIDRHAQGVSLDVCFASGTYTTVGPLMTIFLNAADAARLADLKIK